MAFNAGAFIGGFSQAVSARIQESNKEAARIREEERLEQRSINREARAAQREEEKLKRERERELIDLTQSLALHYDEAQMTSILKSGKAGAKYALEQAKAYRAEDLDPRTMYDLKEFGFDPEVPWYDAFTSDYEECLYIREMLSNREELNKQPRIKLSTIHSAKGGEADNVLLILDNTKTIRDAVEKSSDKQDEEHRVWYVGVTRTKQNLYIMAAKKEDQGYDIESLG